MKNLLFVSLLLLAGPITAFAQPSLSNNPQAAPRFRSNGAENSGFGIKGGVNFNAIQGDGTKKVYNDLKGLTQYHAGIYAQIGISNWFSIQPEALYQRKGFSGAEILTLRNQDNTADSTSTEGKTTVKLNYVSVPLLLVFNVFENVAIQVGPQVSYLFNLRNGSKAVSSATYKYNSVDVGVVGGVEAKLEFLRLGARYDYSVTDLRKGGTFTINNASNVTRRAESDIRNGVFQVYLGVGL